MRWLPGDRGNATVLTLLLLLFALPAAGISIAMAGAADARSRAVAAADLIALAGCDHSGDINRYRETVVIECHDDGVSVSVRTRTRIPLPGFLGLSLFVHARAQGVHML